MIGKKLTLACLLFAACSGTEQVREQKKYYDIKEFFSAEIKRLEKQDASVNKTVSRNGVSETKANFTPSWATELALFTDSDINKPAWRDSYNIQSDSLSTSYTTLDNDLRTKSIHIKKDNTGKLSEIRIVNSTSNYLYNSTEELHYIPDSLYRIVKKQDVILLGKNNYEITGVF
ncbi:MAG: hypothetical protein WBJ10_00265 [Daejeonella sp.]|uniref:hypothetical protein n=1 Tax=Daejeonella sp. TaxID=2805397 RepID=UPI003C72EE79